VCRCSAQRERAGPNRQDCSRGQQNYGCHGYLPVIRTESSGHTRTAGIFAGLQTGCALPTWRMPRSTSPV
jgi:hypothetical protein